MEKFVKFTYDHKDEINLNAFISDEKDVLYRRDGKVLLKCCNKTLKHYEIKEGTIIIGENAFRNAELLEEIIIPESVIAIERGAFSSCDSLKKIFIPKSVLSFEIGGLGSSKNFEAFLVDKDNPSYTSKDGVLYSKKMTCLVRCPAAAKFSRFEIPESVLEISSFAFEDCLNLQEVTIPKNVLYMGNGVFQGCDNLSKVNYLATFCRRAGQMFEAFRYSKNLKTMVIGENVVELPDNLLVGCQALEEINIPKSLTTIGNGVFRICSKLSHIYLSENVSQIGIHAFKTQGKLTLEISKDNPYYEVRDNVIFSKDMKRLYQAMDSGISFKSYVIPQGVTRIEDHAFEWCDFLEEVEIPDSVTYIGKSAFSAGFGLKSITLPSSIEFLGKFSIHSYDLRMITSLKKTPPKCDQLFSWDYRDAQGNNVSYMHKNCVLRVPKGSKQAYMADKDWGLFSTIEEF